MTKDVNEETIKKYISGFLRRYQYEHDDNIEILTNNCKS